MRMVAQSMKDYAILTLDPDGIITSWNAGAERIFGYGSHEAVGDSIDIIFTQEDRAKGRPAAEMQKARQDGRADDDAWHRTKDGRTIFCSGVMTPLVDVTLFGYAKIARDSTEIKALESRRDGRPVRREGGAHPTRADQRPAR